MSKRCIGCGSVLQIENPLETGYVFDFSKDYCMRCFRLKHYHEFQQGIEIDKKGLLDSIKKKKGLFFFFVDFLQLSKESLDYFLDLPSPKILLVSKCDIIPKSLSYAKLEKWITQEFHIQEQILFVQRNSLSSLKKIQREMENYSGNDFYFLGMTNAGKSTFLNAFLREVEGKESSIVESEYPNTTLDFIDISTSLGVIHDSAGIPYDIPLSDKKLFEKSQIKKELHPLNYPLKKGTRLLIEDLIEIEVLEDTSIVCLLSQNYRIQKSYQPAIESSEFFSLKIPDKSNLLIKGVGVFYFKRETSIVLHGLKREHVEVLPSYMGGLS